MGGGFIKRENNPTRRHLRGDISGDNSSNVPLGVGEVFTGAWIEVLDYGLLRVNIYSDKASAVDGLCIQGSSDGVNIDHDDTYTVPAGTGKNYAINPYIRYIRVVYTNGPDAQTEFRLQTMLQGISLASSHRIQDSIINDDDAQLIKAVLTGEDPSSTFQNVKTTVDGNLAISDNSDGLAIAKGDVTGTTFIHKFGYAPDFDSGDGFVSIWDGAEDNESWEAMNYTYSNSADIDRISSTSATDAQQVEIQGLDEDWGFVTQTASLDGQTPAALDTPLIRTFRMINDTSSSFAGHVFAFVNGATSGGVPNSAGDIRAVIHPDANQTEMAVYTIPANTTGYMRDWYAAAAGAKKDSVHTVLLLARPFEKTFQLKHRASIIAVGTSLIQHKYVEPEVFTEKTDIEMQANTDEDGAGVSAGFDIVLVDN